jgi:hypothetical protein
MTHPTTLSKQVLYSVCKMWTIRNGTQATDVAALALAGGLGG